MAINIIVGRPGSGKSYESVVYHVIPAIKQGRKVVTNLPLNVDHFKQVFGDEVQDLIDIRADSFEKHSGVLRPFSKPEHFTDEDWVNEKGQGPLFVIDECHFIYPTTGRGKQAHEDLLDCLAYFSTHRHMGHDIVLMTQSLGKINKDLRDMIEVQYAVSKHTAAGSQKSYTQNVLDGAAGRPKVVDTKVRFYKKEFFPFYTSHTLSSSSVDEAKSADIKPFWKSWVFVVLVPVLIFIFYKVSQGGLNVFSESETQTPAPQPPSSMTQPVILKEKPASVIPARSSTTIKKHPFDKFDLIISGYADNSYFDNSGRFVEDFRYYFKMTKNGSPIGSLRMRDLLLAGYEVNVLSDCVIRLRFAETNFDSFILCSDTIPNSSVGNPIAQIF